MRLLSARASRAASLRSALIGGLGQFRAGIIDDIPCGTRRQRTRIQLRNLVGKDDDDEDQYELGKPGEQQAAIRKDADWRFSGESFGRARERWAEGSLELLPRRRPLDEQPRRIGPGIGNNFGTGFDFNHCLLMGPCLDLKPLLRR